jgi:membrane protein DedA with SNARE-associated domain
MQPFLSPLLSYLLLYKYVTLGIVVFLGAVGAPLPANAMLLAVGAFSGEGYFNFWISLAVAVSTNVAGDLTGYGIARKYGEWVVRKLRLNKSRFFVQLQEELRTDATGTVFATRFASSMSSVANILAGAVKVPFKTFLIPDFWGNFIEPFVLLCIGYAVGDYWTEFSGPLDILAGIVAVGVVMFILWRIYRKMSAKYHI